MEHCGVFSAETGEFLATLGRDLPPTYSLAYGSSGKILAVGSGTELRLLADSTEAPVGRVLQHPSLISAIAFASDEKAVATACHDGAIRVWDVATGESLGPALWHEDFVRDIACSRDGRHLLSGGTTGRYVFGSCRGR